MNSRELSRRDFLMFWRNPAMRRDETSPEQTGTPEPSSLHNPPRPLTPFTMTHANATGADSFHLRPPGALPRGEFETTCERCGHCAETCPSHAIRFVTEGADAGTPYIDPEHAPCTLCHGLQCTQHCPSGALQPLNSIDQVRMGIAQIDATRCTAWRGLTCRVCHEVCPVPGALTLVRAQQSSVPMPGDNTCTGCGLCLHHCRAEAAIRIVERVTDSQGYVSVISLLATEKR